MPINAFSGDPGSGKTYSVVKHVIVPAVEAGRSIVTNIDGLHVEAIYEYVLSRVKPGQIICLGTIRIVGKDDPSRPDFLPYDLDKPNACLVQPGELVVIDEASRYWDSGEKLHSNHLRFFNEHRHFVDEFGHTCDLVVIDPEVNELHRKLRSKIEMTSYTRKPKEIGLTKQYTVSLYRKTNLRRKPFDQSLHTFDKEIYKLYHSYSGGKGKEKPIDKRQNLLLSKKLWFIAGGALAMFVLCAFLVYRFFTGFGQDKTHAQTADARKTDTPPQAAPTPSKPARPDISDTWRVVGYYAVQGDHLFLLADGSGGWRYVVNPPNFYIAGPSISLVLDDGSYTTYSGRSGGGLLEGSKHE